MLSTKKENWWSELLRSIIRKAEKIINVSCHNLQIQKKKFKSTWLFKLIPKERSYQKKNPSINCRTLACQEVKDYTSRWTSWITNKQITTETSKLYRTILSSAAPEMPPLHNSSTHRHRTAGRTCKHST